MRFHISSVMRASKLYVNLSRARFPNCRLYRSRPSQPQQQEEQEAVEGWEGVPAFWKIKKSVSDCAYIERNLKSCRPSLPIRRRCIQLRVTIRVRVDIIGHARIKYVVKYQSCMF